MNKTFFIKWFIVAATLILILSVFVLKTQTRFSVTADEKKYFDTSRSFVEWWTDNDPGELFRKDIIEAYWDVSHEHPSLLKIVSSITWSLGKSVRGDFGALRIGTLFWFALFFMVWTAVIIKGRGSLFAGAASLLFILHPHVLGYSHLAEITVQLTCLWGIMLALLYVSAGQKSPVILTVISGLLWGLAVAAKVTSLLLIIVGIVYLAWKRPKYLAGFIVLWCVSGFLSFFLSWPVLWTEGPSFFIEHIRYFQSLNMTGETYYAGGFYASLPWHYPWVMFFITLPVLLIPFLLLGIYRAVQFPDDFGILCLINVLVVLGGLSIYTDYPGDGIRHFLVIYPAIGYLAALGMVKRSTPRLHALCVCLVLFVLLFENILVFPDEFKYYNVLVGGNDGVMRWGLRAQYYP